MIIKRHKYKSESSNFSIKIQSFDGIVLVPIWLGRSLYIIKFDKLRTPKQIYKSWKWQIKRKLLKLDKKFTHWYRYNFDDDPVYYSVTSIDCDCVASYHVGKSEDYREHYLWMNDSDAWDWVEGSTSVDIISEEEYLLEVNEPVKTYDHIMAAYENGNGRNVII